jgi:hypothetical protein
MRDRVGNLAVLAAIIATLCSGCGQSPAQGPEDTKNELAQSEPTKAEKTAKQQAKQKKPGGGQRLVSPLRRGILSIRGSAPRSTLPHTWSARS